MRVYFEKPRTTIGWKGLINDPDLDGRFNIRKGMWLARKVLTDVLSLGLPAATEWLDPITPQYICDAISWGAIGARNTESQVTANWPVACPCRWLQELHRRLHQGRRRFLLRGRLRASLPVH